MALATNYKFFSCITSKIFQGVKYICLQKLATGSAQLSNKGKTSPPNPKEQQKDVTGLSSSVYTTPTHDPNYESNNRIASPDPNSPSSVAEYGNASPDPNSPSYIAEYGNETSNTITKEADKSFLPAVNYAGHLKNLALLNLPQHNKDTPPSDMQKFVTGHLPQNIVDSFYSESSKTEVNIKKVSTRLPDVHDNKLLLMSVELGMIPESVQLLCSELTPCKQVSKSHKVNDAESINNLITNIEDQCKLLNGVCESDYNKLFLIALELGSIPQGLQTFFNEHFFVNNSKFKENDLLAKEFTQLTENITTGEKFSVGVTSILSLLYGAVPRIFDEYLNMSNSVNDNIQRTALQETHKRDNSGNTPSSAKSFHEEDTTSDQKVNSKGNHSNTSTKFYSNAADAIKYIGNEKDASTLESFLIKKKPIPELPRDIIKASGVFGMKTPRDISQVRDPNHEISPKMTNPAPKSPYSILTEENVISVGQPSPSIQPEEICKHSLLSAQHAPGVVKEVPIIFSKPHIDNDHTPPLTENKTCSTDLAESKLKSEKKSGPEQSEELTHLSNIQNMKLCLLTAELGILSKHSMLYCSKVPSCPPITTPKGSIFLEQHEFSKKDCIYNLFLVMLECGILPIGIKTVTCTDIHDSPPRHLEKCCKSAEDLSVNYIHKPEPMKIKHALIPWKSAPNALIIAKEMPIVPIAAQPVTVDISEFIKSNTHDFLQQDKLKECLHVFEIPLYNEESTKISTVEHNTDAHLYDSKNSNFDSEVYGTNTSIGDDVQQDNVKNISSSKNSDLCNEAQTSKSFTTSPAGRIEQNVSNYKSHTKNNDKLTITETVVSRKPELEVLNYRGTVDNMKPQTGIHISNVKQIHAHEPQETDWVIPRSNVTLSSMNMLTGSEISNTSEYLNFASYIIDNPKRKVQENTESNLSAKSNDLTAPSGNINNVKPNVMEKTSNIVSPVKTVMLPLLDTNDSIYCNIRNKINNKNFALSPEQAVMSPVLDTNDTLSISCSVGKEEANKKNFVVSPEQTVTLPVLDTSDTLSVSCNIGKERANNKNFVVSPEQTVTLPVLDTNDTLSISCSVGKEEANKKNFVVSPEQTVTLPVLDTSDTLSVSCNIGKERANNKNFVVSPEQTVTLPVLDTNDTLSVSCNIGKEEANKKNFVVSPEQTVTLPVLDTSDTLSVSCNIGKERANNKNFVVSPEQTVTSPISDTNDTLSISCNVGKEKVENLIANENVADKNIVSVFYANLCSIKSKNSYSNKHTHANKQDTTSSNMPHNSEEHLNFTNKAQRSIEAIVKAVTDKYNNSVNKLSAHYTSKSDACSPSVVETSDFHMGDIFKQHIWKPFTINIWKVFDYLNNINLHKASTNLAFKSDFPQKLESCDLEIYHKLNSQFLLTQINKDNVFMISKYKYLSELCPEPFVIYPKLKLESGDKEAVKLHLEKCPTEVAGPSSSVVVVCDGEVGPGASKVGDYKNPEYFSYHKESYFEAEVEMLKYRLPQPSSQEK